MYEHVLQLTHACYGLCYFIPYGKEQIKGAIFYPIKAILQEDGRYQTNGELDLPDNITTQRLNQEIRLTQRFLYSTLFKNLQSQKLQVEPGLVEMTNLLNEKVVPIPEEESSIEIIKTKTNAPFIKFKLRYNVKYIGKDYSAVWGLHWERIRIYLSQAIWEVTGKNVHPNDITYTPLSQLEFSLSLPEDISFSPHQHSLGSLIPMLMITLNRIVLEKDFLIEQHYEYKFWGCCSSPEIGNPTVGGSSNTGGSTGNGGGTGMGGNSGIDNDTKYPLLPPPKCPKCNKIFEECNCTLSFRIKILNKNYECKLGEPLGIQIEIFGRDREAVDIIALQVTKQSQGEDWRPFGYEAVKSQTTVMKRTFFNPGVWLFRVGFQLKSHSQPIYGYSNIGFANILYPDINEFKDHPKVVEHLKKLWQKSVEFAEQNKSTHAVREFGSLILRDPSGAYFFTEEAPGPIVYLTEEGVAASMTFKVEYEDWNNPTRKEPIVIGSMHVHCPLTWAKGKYERDAGPSKQDNSAQQLWPGLVYDYTNKIKSGDPVDNPENPLKIWTYGPQRSSF